MILVLKIIVIWFVIGGIVTVGFGWLIHERERKFRQRMADTRIDRAIRQDLERHALAVPAETSTRQGRRMFRELRAIGERHGFNMGTKP